jgi:uncharacterized protein
MGFVILCHFYLNHVSANIEFRGLEMIQMVETVFSPVAGTIGGVLIGLSAVILMLATGRIAGLSGIFNGLLTLDFGSEFKWRLIFVLGLLIGTAWTGLLFPETRSISFVDNTSVIALGGLLVGAGVTLGSGCTSGHGICGIARLSPRSILATCVFMATAIATVFLVRHVS